MLTWLANLLSGGRLDRTERRVEELERERDYAWEGCRWAETEARHYRMVAKTWEANADADNRSRRGWRWLYEAKCAEWAEAVKENRTWQVAIDLIERAYNGTITRHQQQLTQERGLRDGWEQTAGELQAQVRQGDNNLQRVEAERDEALGQLLDVGLERDPETGRFRSAD